MNELLSNLLTVSGILTCTGVFYTILSIIFTVFCIFFRDIKGILGENKMLMLNTAGSVTCGFCDICKKSIVCDLQRKCNDCSKQQQQIIQ